MSWLGRVARLGLRRTSDTSLQVTCIPSSQQSNLYHPKVSRVSTLVVQWYEQPYSMHEVLGSNLQIVFKLPIMIY